MASGPVRITLVRWRGREAGERLNGFVNGGVHAARRAPRGLDPDYVSRWLRENIVPDCAPSAMVRTVDVLRFYERKDPVWSESSTLTFA